MAPDPTEGRGLLTRERCVHQTIVGGADSPAPGDCLAAAIATLLHLPLTDVPHFVAMDDDWTRPLRRWSAERGLYPLDVDFQGEDVWHHHTPVLHIAIGGSPRLEGETHAVVAARGEVVHDPHPDGGGLTDLRMGLFFVPLDPARLATSRRLVPAQEEADGD